MHWVRTNISSIYYFTEIPIILKQHIQSDWITNELRKPWGDVLGTLSAHGYSKLWRTSFSMKKPPTWCKSGRVSLVSSSCLYKTQSERALAQVCHTRIDALSPDEYQFHLLLHQNSHYSQATYPKCGRTDGRTDGRTCRKTVTVDRMDQRTHVQVEIGYFGLRTDGQTTRKHNASGA